MTYQSKRANVFRMLCMALLMIRVQSLNTTEDPTSMQETAAETETQGTTSGPSETTKNDPPSGAGSTVHATEEISSPATNKETGTTSTTGTTLDSFSATISGAGETTALSAKPLAVIGAGSGDVTNESPTAPDTTISSNVDDITAATLPTTIDRPGTLPTDAASTVAPSISTEPPAETSSPGALEIVPSATPLMTVQAANASMSYIGDDVGQGVVTKQSEGLPSAASSIIESTTQLSFRAGELTSSEKSFVSAPSGRSSSSSCEHGKCLHGGSCFPTSHDGHTYICSCMPRYEGPHCETWAWKEYEDLKITLLAVSVAASIIVLFLVITLAVVCCSQRTPKEPCAEDTRAENRPYHMQGCSLPRPSFKPNIYREVSIEMNENLQRRQLNAKEQKQVDSQQLSDNGNSQLNTGKANTAFAPDDAAAKTSKPATLVESAATMPRVAASAAVNGSTIPRTALPAATAAADAEGANKVSASAATSAHSSGSNPAQTRRQDLVYF